MTNEEAILQIQDASDDVVRYWDIRTEVLYQAAKKRLDAFEMAIKALQEQRQHGFWKPGGDFPLRCSECNRGSVQPEKFCMSCGADMR